MVVEELLRMVAVNDDEEEDEDVGEEDEDELDEDDEDDEDELGGADELLEDVVLVVETADVELLVAR